MSELLPCPFCGGETIRTYTATCSQNQQLYRIGDRLFPIARCGGCYAEACGKDGDRGVGTAIAAWNRRATPDLRALVRDMAEALDPYRYAHLIERARE